MQVQPSTPDVYSISQLSRAFNTSPRALRYYESKGLLTPERDGPYRVYSRREVRRIRIIVEARELGLSIAQIRDVLDLYRPSDKGRAQVKKVVDYLRRRLSRLEAEARKATAKLAELEGQLTEPGEDYRGATGARSRSHPDNGDDLAQPHRASLPVPDGGSFCRPTASR